MTSLDVDAIVRRLHEIDQEARALRVLLRAARAREAATRRQQATSGQGVTRAS